MKINDLHPSKFLKGSDVEGDTPVVISKVTFETLKNNEGEEEEKPVLWFRGVEKGLVLNPTNKKRILQQHPAKDTDEWIGKRITLHLEMVEAFGKSDWAIRVKMLPPQKKGGALAGASTAAAFGGDDDLPPDVAS